MSPHESKATSSRFTPGRGLIPPYLAGREYEQRRLNRQHDLVAAGERVPADMVLVGPRGNGKTALLRWFENTTGERGEADVVGVTPTEIASVAEMADAFAPDSIPGEGTLRAGVGRLSGEWTLDVFEPGIPSLMAHVLDEATRSGKAVTIAPGRAAP